METFAALDLEMLQARRELVSARTVLTQIVSRRWTSVSESTLPHLRVLAQAVSDSIEDTLAAREILNTAVMTRLALSAERTNQLVRRLTAISVIFLPLTFLAGVYGTNFEHVPEYGWRFGYLGFWAAAVLVGAILVSLARAKRLL